MDCGREIAVTPIVESGIIVHFTGLLKVDKVRPVVGERKKFKVKFEGVSLQMS